MSNKSKSGTSLLAGKHFFIDPKVDKATSAKVKQKLIALGGKVDEFLDKGIHFALTSAAILGTSSKDGRRHRLSPYSPFGTTSPTTDQSSSMGHRWKRLAKQASAKVQSSSIVETAKSFGIKIRLIDDVLSWLNKKTEHMNINAAGSIVPPQQPNNIKLKDPCLKVEDFACALKPIYEEFESFSQLDLSVRGTKCPMVNNHSQTRAKPTAKKNQEKKGFCECCQCSYLNERKHRKTSEHLNFGETESHFMKLDDYVASQNLNLEKFLSRFKTGNEEEVKLDATCENRSAVQQPEPKASDTELEESLTHSSLKSPATNSAADTAQTLNVTPLRRSPRKCVKMDSSKFTNTKQCLTPGRNKSKRLVLNSHDQNKNAHYPAPEFQARLLPQPTLNNASNLVTVKESQILPSTFSANSGLISFSKSPPVELHEVPSSSFRRRIRSCDASSPKASLAAELSDSPLSRLRSFKRKIHELGGVPPTSEQSSCRAETSQRCNKGELVPCSDELIFSFRSSTGDCVTESEFIGF